MSNASGIEVESAIKPTSMWVPSEASLIVGDRYIVMVMAVWPSPFETKGEWLQGVLRGGLDACGVASSVWPRNVVAEVVKWLDSQRGSSPKIVDYSITAVAWEAKTISLATLHGNAVVAFSRQRYETELIANQESSTMPTLREWKRSEIDALMVLTAGAAAVDFDTGETGWVGTRYVIENYGAEEFLSSVREYEILDQDCKLWPRRLSERAKAAALILFNGPM